MLMRSSWSTPLRSSISFKRLWILVVICSGVSESTVVAPRRARTEAVGAITFECYRLVRRGLLPVFPAWAADSRARSSGSDNSRQEPGRSVGSEIGPIRVLANRRTG